METATLERVEQVSAAEWNAVAGGDNPFVRHEFLAALERNACVGPGTGWRPCHLIAKHDGRIVAAMPLYEKDDSWGEFVFDWSWARAYQQAGLHYYPKLVCAVPFLAGDRPTDPGTAGKRLRPRRTQQRCYGACA